MKFIRFSDRNIVNRDFIKSIFIKDINDAFAIMIEDTHSETPYAVKACRTLDEALKYIDCIFIRLSEAQ